MTDALLPIHPDPELIRPESGPRPTTSLRSRGSRLAAPDDQLASLHAVDLSGARYGGDFEAALTASGHQGLWPAPLEIFQINVGKLCNMTCKHCHVDAGPDRFDEVMSRETVDACLRALDLTVAHTVDITGGAPELNPSFRYLVDECVARGKHVMDRCNLTVLLIPRCRDLPEWLAERKVEIVASLPHVRPRSTDAQRGDGAFEKSIEALRRLNNAGYGGGDECRRLTLMANPVGAFLPGDQVAMEREWKATLVREHGVVFDRLIALSNMPISRYLEWLEQSGNLTEYLELLANSFNPATVNGLMCRNTISVGWDGRVYDCDFNQMLAMQSQGDRSAGIDIRDFDPAAFASRRIVTDRHCFGCTAGAGSSCGGSLDG